VLCAGIAVLDEIFRVARFPAVGTKAQASEYMAVNGGCAANAALAIARLGGRARFAGPLGGPAGEDAIGDRILAGLARESVDTRGVVRIAGVRSPLSAIILDAAGERTIATYRDQQLSQVPAPDPSELLAGVDAVLVDNRLPDFVLPICVAAKTRNIPIVLDADLLLRDTDPLATAASHLVLSAEAMRAAGIDDPSAAITRLATVTPSFLALTDGPNDVLWLNDGKIAHMPVFPVVAVDTLGAGDVFHGAFTLALAEGHDERAAMRFAAAAASIKCTRFGGILGAPVRNEVDALVATR
jgi:sugar/nucleoside kinase (ribokinase family)